MKDYMNAARKWLNRGWRMEAEIKALLDLKAEERERVTSMTSSTADVVVRGGGDVHKFDRLVELESKIDEVIDAELAVKREILDVINRVRDVRLRNLLIDRYVRFMPFEHISVQMNYGYRQVMRLHKIALRIVGEELEKMSLNVT